MKRISFNQMNRMGYFLSKEILEVHIQLTLERKHLYLVVLVKTGLLIIYHANISTLFLFQRVIGDGILYPEVF